MRGLKKALTDANSVCRRVFLPEYAVLRQAICLEKYLDESRIRLVNAFLRPPMNHPGGLDVVRGPRARTVVTIAVPQAAVVHHGPGHILTKS